MINSFKVSYSPEAVDDLRNIYGYIAFELLAPGAAKNQTDRIRKVIRSLDFMPERHALVEWEPWKSRNAHRVPVDKFVVFYTVDPEMRNVTILRILFSGQDIETVF